jgi:7-cyano-7-deazaguanine synthase
MPAQELAIVLVSGGLDSCVTAAIANQSYKLAFLHANYGQRTEERELTAFNQIADFYNVDKRLVTDISYLKKIRGSSLIDKNMEIPNKMSEKDVIPTTYVPFRNTHLLAIAVSWAEVIGAEAIFIGAVQSDSSGYPDCRKEYYQAFNKLIDVGTKPGTRIKVITPLIDMDKAHIILKGNTLRAPLEFTWSCYRNEDVACGECESCILRLEGFKKAGLIDPLMYKKRK